MLHGYLRELFGDRARVYSAGIATHGLNPRAAKVMQEDGVDISHHESNHVDEYKHVQWDWVISVCDHANEHCPVLPGKFKRTHRNFPDPAKVLGSDPEIMQAFREVRDMLKAFAQNLYTEARTTDSA